jgi:hypothetical protein
MVIVAVVVAVVVRGVMSDGAFVSGGVGVVRVSGHDVEWHLHGHSRHAVHAFAGP